MEALAFGSNMYYQSESRLKIYEEVSKYATNGSKTAVMDVIGFLCVSLGSSTIQLHDSSDSRLACAYSEAGFCNQNCNRA
jgi:hypothetical protein